MRFILFCLFGSIAFLNAFFAYANADSDSLPIVKLDSTIHSIFYSSSDSVINEKWYYHYDSLNNVRILEDFRKDSSQSVFYCYSKLFHSYMNSSKLTESVLRVLNKQNNEFQVNQQSTYIYNENNHYKFVEKRIFAEMPYGNQCIEKQITNYSDDGRKSDDMKLIYESVSDSFILAERIIYQYDENGFDDEWIYYKSLDTIMVLSGKIDFDYDSIGKILEDVYYEWNSELEVYLEYFKEEFLYLDADAYYDECYQYQWNSHTNQFQKNKYYQYEHDILGNVIKMQLATFDSISNKWIDEYKSFYSYNKDSSVVCLNEYRYQNEFSSWQPISKYYYFYSSLTDTADSPHLPIIPHSYKIKQYPYIAKNQITIDTEYTDEVFCEIYSLKGLLIKKFDFDGGIYSLNISNWDNGMYICRVIAGINDVSFKFVKVEN